MEDRGESLGAGSIFNPLSAMLDPCYFIPRRSKVPSFSISSRKRRSII
jgi:hypothetical protein